MKPGVAVRVAAAHSVGRVVRDGAYANVVVRNAAAPMDTRSAAAFQYLVFTVLRMLPRIDRTVGVTADRPVAGIDPEVLDVLRVATAELLFSATPDYGAVDSAVEAVRHVAGPRATGFVNGVLRAVVRRGEPDLPDGDEGTALRHGVAPWLWQRLARTWGEDTAGAFLEASNRDAPIGIRARRPHRLGSSPVPGITGAAYLTAPAGIADAAASGEVVVIDPASTAVALAVAARPGMRIADLAAAPGGKTAHLWDEMEGTGLLVAADRNARRLDAAVRRLDAMDIRPAWVVMDGVRPALRRGSFDRVLLDAPCTGLGTLRRRPEIRHRLRPGSSKAMAQTQRGLLDAALELVGPGGAVVYSVCTVLPEETVDLVAGYEAAPPPGLPGKRWGRGLLLGPHLTGTDGMFISVVRPVSR